MQEQHGQINLYGFMQRVVYGIVILDILCLVFIPLNVPVISQLMTKLARIGIFYPPIKAKVFTLIAITLVAIGTKAKKKRDLNIWTGIVVPIGIGMLLMILALFFVPEAQSPLSRKIIGSWVNLYQLIYAIFSLIGAFLIQKGADSISKMIKTEMGKDRWNVEEESFDQNKECVYTDTSINIPYLFRYNKQTNKGFLNIDPFRGTLVAGVPGSGKTFGIINPAIRQFIAKGFTMCLYDFKHPALGEIAYYHYLLQKKINPEYHHKFSVINLNDVEKSQRVNPLNQKYVRTLAQAQDMAESMVSALQKGGGSGSGSDQFFTKSAENFLASCIYFFATYKNGMYSDLPHLLAFMNKSYKEIFDTLFSNEELESMLSPFKSAYENKAFDQLEGQVGTLKIFLSRLASKESYWIFSGDDIDLKISDRENPTILVLASDPNTQDINSALYASVLNRTLKVINDKGNIPCAIIADEFPTIYIHKIDNVIATARSNKIAVMLGLQELPQLKQFYKKEVAETITSVTGNILSGAVRDKQTLDWLEKMFGKIKQKTYSESYSKQGHTQNINEKMDFMIPAGKIATLKTGEMVGMLAKGNSEINEEYKTSAMMGKIELNMKNIQHEEAHYPKMPYFYRFKDNNGNDNRHQILTTNFRRINAEVSLLVSKFLKTE